MSPVLMALTATQNSAHASHHHAAVFVARYLARRCAGIAHLTIGGLVDEEPHVTRVSGLRQGDSGADDEVHAALVAVIAGSIAEARYDPQSRRSLVPDEEIENGRLAREHARSIVEAQWGAICALARELMQRGSIPRAWAELIIEDANGHQPAKSALAAQRASEAREVA